MVDRKMRREELDRLLRRAGDRCVSRNPWLTGEAATHEIESLASRSTIELARLHKDDPALVALNKIATLLTPYERQEQLKILAAACSQLGMANYAIAFLQEYQRREP